MAADQQSSTMETRLLCLVMWAHWLTGHCHRGRWMIAAVDPWSPKESPLQPPSLYDKRAPLPPSLCAAGLISTCTNRSRHLHRSPRSYLLQFYVFAPFSSPNRHRCLFCNCWLLTETWSDRQTLSLVFCVVSSWQEGVSDMWLGGRGSCHHKRQRGVDCCQWSCSSGTLQSPEGKSITHYIT